MNKIDSTCKPNSYINKTRADNKNAIKQAMNGMEDMNQLSYLQIKGQNQLKKEIEDYKAVKDKKIDFDIFHKNEMTGEIEDIYETIGDKVENKMSGMDVLANNLMAQSSRRNKIQPIKSAKQTLNRN